MLDSFNKNSIPENFRNLLFNSNLDYETMNELSRPIIKNNLRNDKLIEQYKDSINKHTNEEKYFKKNNIHFLCYNSNVNEMLKLFNDFKLNNYFDMKNWIILAARDNNDILNYIIQNIHTHIHYDTISDLSNDLSSDVFEFWKTVCSNPNNLAIKLFNDNINNLSTKFLDKLCVTICYNSNPLIFDVIKNNIHKFKNISILCEIANDDIIELLKEQIDNNIKKYICNLCRNENTFALEIVKINYPQLNLTCINKLLHNTNPLALDILKTYFKNERLKLDSMHVNMKINYISNIIDVNNDELFDTLIQDFEILKIAVIGDKDKYYPYGKFWYKLCSYDNYKYIDLFIKYYDDLDNRHYKLSNYKHLITHLFENDKLNNSSDEEITNVVRIEYENCKNKLLYTHDLLESNVEQMITLINANELYKNSIRQKCLYELHKNTNDKAIQFIEMNMNEFNNIDCIENIECLLLNSNIHAQELGFKYIDILTIQKLINIYDKNTNDNFKLKIFNYIIQKINDINDIIILLNSNNEQFIKVAIDKIKKDKIKNNKYKLNLDCIIALSKLNNNTFDCIDVINDYFVNTKFKYGKKSFTILYNLIDKPCLKYINVIQNEKWDAYCWTLYCSNKLIDIEIILNNIHQLNSNSWNILMMNPYAFVIIRNYISHFIINKLL